MTKIKIARVQLHSVFPIFLLLTDLLPYFPSYSLTPLLIPLSITGLSISTIYMPFIPLS